MIRKVVYSWEYIDSWEKFEKTKLSPKNVFYSKLIIKGVSNYDLKCAASLQEYHGKKDPRFLSEHLLENTHFNFGRCISDLPKYVLKVLQVRSSTFVHST